MASASWRRHFSVDEGLDKFTALQIKRPQFDDPSKRPGHHPSSNARESRVTSSTKNRHTSGHTSGGSSSAFQTNRSRDLSEKILLPSRLRALSDDISDISASKYSSGDDLESEVSMGAPRKASGDAWRVKYDADYDNTHKPPIFGDDHTGSGLTRHHESWGFMTAEEDSGIMPSISQSASYPDFDGATSSTSGSMFAPSRHKNVRSPASSRMSSTLDLNPRRKGNPRSRGDDPNGTRTSGYNTYSEMSDFTNYNKSKDPRKLKTLPAAHKRDGSQDNDTMSRRKVREDPYARRGSSTLDNRSTGRSGLYARSISANDSDISLSSKDRSHKSNEKDKRGSTQSLADSRHQHSETKTQKVPSIGNVSVTVTNNIQYDPNDPFSFIQPVDLPFHKKVRKCMGPIAAVILLLILAAALGAAIYFASELKETQEKQIDLLRANLAMKIRNTDILPNIDSMTSQDMNNLSRTYCKQMDIFYSKSDFKETYRGCEVISFQNDFLNFTLFFVEKEATSSEIIGVIESSAKKVTDASQTVAVVDKFELELDTVRVTMERRMEPETFNKKTLPDPVVTPKPSTALPVNNDNPTTTKLTTAGIPNKVTPKDRPIYSWGPCEEGYNGTYFPHPTDCSKFFHCSNRVSIERNCTKGLLYYWQEFTCVSRFTPNIECPDPSKAPPRPTTVTTPTTTVDRSETSADPYYDEFYPDDVTEGTNGGTTRPSRTYNGESKSAIAGKYPGRPTYSANPCKNGADGRLYAHPDDCARFIQCVNGREMVMNCSGGLVFNPADTACIFPPNPELVCPDIQPCKNKETGYFSHPFDCTKFIQCQSRTEKVLSCSGDLVWNPSVNSCIHDPNSPLCKGNIR